MKNLNVEFSNIDKSILSSLISIFTKFCNSGLLFIICVPRIKFLDNIFFILKLLAANIFVNFYSHCYQLKKKIIRVNKKFPNKPIGKLLIFFYLTNSLN